MVIIVQTSRGPAPSYIRFDEDERMRVVIAGGTGFLGSPLAETYAEDGHDVRLLTRGLPPGESRHESGTGVPGITRIGWNPNGQDGAGGEGVVGGGGGDSV